MIISSLLSAMFNHIYGSQSVKNDSVQLPIVLETKLNFLFSPSLLNRCYFFSFFRDSHILKAVMPVSRSNCSNLLVYSARHHMLQGSR